MPAPSTIKPPYNDISARQEAFSRSYIRAVVSIAGCTIAGPETDNDKLDLLVLSRVRGTTFTKPVIGIQAKCQLGSAASSDPLSYTLDMDTYDNLRDPLVTNPRILVLVLVPPDFNNWAIQSEAQLALMHCGYWVSLLGAPEVVGQASKTVHIPRANVFTPHRLQSMMSDASNGLALSVTTTPGGVLL